MNILLGDISSYKAIVVAKFIRNNYSDFTIYSFDTRNFTKHIHTSYIHKNILVRDYNVDTFTAIIDQYNIDYFIPVINESLNTFWKAKNKFGSTLNYLGSFESYEVLNDKLKLHALAEKFRIKVPKKFGNSEEAKIPFVIKPTNLSSAKGVIYIQNKNEIPENYNYKNTIIQQFVKGKGVGYSFYCLNGKIINGYGHERLAEYPVSGGSSTYRKGYDDIRMIEAAEKIVKHLEYTGFAMFEFKLTDSNELFLLEVNPRIWGSINQGLANGINYFEKILGEQKTGNKSDGKQRFTYVGPLIYLSLLKYILRFKMKPLVIFLSNSFNNTPDINIFKDPKGYLSTILRKLLR